MKQVKSEVIIRTILLYSLLVIILSSCSPVAGPKNFSYRKGGNKYCRSKIYGYPDGKKKLAEVNLYRNDTLFESTIYYELWPNNDGWKFVSKKGFKTVDKGKFLLIDTSFKAPDNIIYTYINKQHKEVIEVYKDGKRIPFTGGHYDGYESMQFLVDTPGVYKWKNGKEYFLRPFTEQEWKSTLYTNAALNKQMQKDSLSRKQLDSIINIKALIIKDNWYLKNEKKQSIAEYDKIELLREAPDPNNKHGFWFRSDGSLNFSESNGYDGVYYNEKNKWELKKDAFMIDEHKFKILKLTESEFNLEKIK
ncbi:MAG: hypothetical protein JNL24_08695 [Bacteroidia bacterium]|nr:hypothetical protein [Bacteroidia bacterium]